MSGQGTRANEWGWLDLAYQWLNLSKSECPDTSHDLYTEVTRSYNKVREFHDRVLEAKGPNYQTVGGHQTYRTLPYPISQKLRKKKKYKKLLDEKSSKVRHYDLTFLNKGNVTKRIVDEKFFKDSQKIYGSFR